MNENIEIDHNEVYVDENTKKPPQQQTTNDAWEGEVDTLHSKSDSDILSFSIFVFLLYIELETSKLHQNLYSYIEFYSSFNPINGFY